MIKICKYCEKEIEFNNGKQFGGHLTNCKSNPKKIEKNIQSIKKKNIVLVCTCGKEYNIYITDNQFKKNKYRKFCSGKCSNKRVHSEETKNKISKKLSTGITLHKNNCKKCNKEFKNRKKTQIYCSKRCAGLNNINFKNVELCRMAGRKSVLSQNRRSKNEVLFGELCQLHFKNVSFNKPIFNGWDADIIIDDIKVAILWNGIWHYKKITKKHSVEQVQNRDNIKIKEIKKMGYYPYIIKDMGKCDQEKIKIEWEIFNIWLSNKDIEII